jgi:hypothetical protein
MPIATASPCFNANPPEDSSAWPIVCPRLRTRLSPVSRSSFSTTEALSATAVSTIFAFRAVFSLLIRGAFRSMLTEEGGIKRCGDLDDFGEPVPELVLGERQERLRIDINSRRLVKCADQVLPRGMIDPHLSADAAVDLGEEGGGDLDKADAAQHGGGEVAGEIADHPPPSATTRLSRLTPPRKSLV